MLKIKVINSQTSESHERILRPDMGKLEECIVGRNSNCALVLDSKEVSRVHGGIFWEDGQYCFTDLGSVGGSKVNNQEINVNELYPLKVGDVIRICKFVLLIEQIELTDDRTVANSHYPPTITLKPSPWSQDEAKTLTVYCQRLIDETEDARTFVLAADPPVLFDYYPGQFVTLDLLINDQRVKRSYSISSTPSRPHTLEITVKRVPATEGYAPGLVSNWLHDHLKVGDEVTLKGPLGEFTCCPDPAKKLLFISAGSGITPMMSMSRFLCDTAADVDIVFFHSARTPRDIIYRRELEMMAVRYSNFKPAITVTRPPEVGAVWLGYTGRLDEAMLRSLAPDFLERTVYVCGPSAFMEGTKSVLAGLGFPMDSYYEESFGGPPKVKPTKIISPLPSSPQNGAAKAASNGASAIAFVKSGKEVPWDGQHFILDIAEELDVDIDIGCRKGTCGSCKQKMLAGEVSYEGTPIGLKNKYKEQGFILTCIAKPVGRVEIDV